MTIFFLSPIIILLHTMYILYITIWLKIASSSQDFCTTFLTNFMSRLFYFCRIIFNCSWDYCVLISFCFPGSTFGASSSRFCFNGSSSVVSSTFSSELSSPCVSSTVLVGVASASDFLQFQEELFPLSSSLDYRCFLSTSSV